LGAARRYEASTGMRVRRGARSTDARLDAGRRVPSLDAGEPAEMSALRVAASARGVHCSAERATRASVTRRTGRLAAVREPR